MLLVVIGFSGVESHAQGSEDRVASSPNPDQTIEGWRAQLDQISSAITREGISENELFEFRARVKKIEEAAEDLSENLRPEISNLTNRIEKLAQAEAGALSGNGEPSSTDTAEAGSDNAQEDQPQVTATENEAPAPDTPLSAAEETLSKQKQNLKATVQKLNAQLGRAQVIVLRSDDLIKQITQIRRDRFSRQLFGQSKSILAPSLWVSAISEFIPLGKGLVAILAGGAKRVWTEVPYLFFGLLALGILISYLLLRHSRFLQISDILSDDAKAPQAGEVHSSTWHKTGGLNAIKRVVRSLVLITLTPFIILLALNQADVLSTRLYELLSAIMQGLFYYTLARGLSIAIYSPNRPAHRLVAVSDQTASWVHNTNMLCLTIALVGFTSLDFARTLVASLDAIVVLYGDTAVLFSVAALACYFTRPGKNEEIHLFSDTAIIFKILAIFGLIALLAALTAPILGYAFLGAFAVSQVILAGIISAILFIVFKLLDAYLGYPQDDQTDGVSVTRASSEQKRRFTQMIMLGSGLCKVSLTLLALVVFAASWGLDTTGIWEDLARIFQEIKIGELTISPVTIVTALVILALGLLVTRSLQRWFANRFLPTTTLDVGLRNSITTSLGYVGFIISAMIAFSQAGLDLSNLAIVAGALSLGIGFGLQSIVSNFVSGIILLAERPIKAGDWIEVGGEQGTVRKISVRSTEIETFDRATVIVPNADFISGSVKNMMYGNTIGRFIVTVGVGYDSDPERVRELLLECAKEHSQVLAYPESYVVFSEFGASSLDFQLRGYIADCGKSLGVRSDLRFAIFKRLKEAGIEIPFPQRDINIKGMDNLKEALAPHQTPVSNEMKPERPTTHTSTLRDEIDSDNG